MIVESSKEGTVLTWDEYYDAPDLDMMRAEYDQAFADIGKNLVLPFRRQGCHSLC